MLILSTERLRLRWFRADDAPFLLRLVNDPDWLTNIGDRGVRDEAAALAYVRDRLVDGCWRLGFGFWLVERAGDGERLGMCGLTWRESLPAPDLGFAFLPQFRGQGYAREAARACLRYAAEVLELDTVLAITASHNERSQHLLRDLSMVVDPAGSGADADEELVRWRWRAARPRDGVVDETAAVERLVRRFRSLFDQQGPQPMSLPILPLLCTPQVRFRQIGGNGLDGEDLRTFLSARAAAFACELADCREVETSARVDRHGPLAQHWSNFVATGRRCGVAFRVEGWRSLQLVQGPQGWRIAAVAECGASACGESGESGEGPVPSPVSGR
jgi:RimJ/RimL family protein N-acetyltransferase